MPQSKLARRAVLAGSALAALPARPKAADGELTAYVSGGVFADGNIAAMVKPFEEATGIKVNAVKSEIPPAQFELAARNGTLDVDILLKTEADGTVSFGKGYLTPIDYSLYDPKETAGMSEAARKPWGVEHIEAG